MKLVSKAQAEWENLYSSISSTLNLDILQLLLLRIGHEESWNNSCAKKNENECTNMALRKALKYIVSELYPYVFRKRLLKPHS